MAMGEFTSVKTQNEQVDREWAKERAEIAANGPAEERELAEMFAEMGMSHATAEDAARQVHADPAQAALLHVTQELGLDPLDKPSPRVAAVSSFFTFSAGALVPLIPFLLGFTSLTLGLAVGGVGLLVAGGLAALATGVPWWLSATGSWPSVPLRRARPTWSVGRWASGSWGRSRPGRHGPASALVEVLCCCPLDRSTCLLNRFRRLSRMEEPEMPSGRFTPSLVWEK